MQDTVLKGLVGDVPGIAYSSDFVGGSEVGEEAGVDGGIYEGIFHGDMNLGGVGYVGHVFHPFGEEEVFPEVFDRIPGIADSGEVCCAFLGVDFFEAEVAGILEGVLLGEDSRGGGLLVGAVLARREGGEDCECNCEEY